MNRIDRLTTIVIMLQSGRTLRAQEIAEYFGISLRTVYRDIRTIENAGIPIFAEVGKGYSLVQDYRLPPIVFTPDEASALCIGGKFVDLFTDPALNRHMNSALLKIRAVLPNEHKEHWTQLEQIVEIEPEASSMLPKYPPMIIQLQNAIIHRQVLAIQYLSYRSQEVSNRKIEPLGLLFYSHHWHLIAFCQLRQDLRDFRTDRIQSLAPQEIQFDPREDFSLKDYFKASQRLESPIPIEVRFPKSIYENLKEHYFYGFVETVEVADGYRVSFLVPSFKWIFHWLLGFGTAIEVLSPVELRQKFLQEAQGFRDLYQDP